MVTYREAGVDIQKAELFVESIREMAKKTYGPWVLKGIGGFSAAVRVPEGYRRPLLVASTDGVGTKLKIAQAMSKYDTVGIDLVAMCVNDLLPLGARPLFLLDYLASGRLEPERDRQLIQGIVQGCQEAGCALVGGETAEMPGLYQEGDFDLVGFVVGVVEEERLIDGSQIKGGDVVIGLASTGVHSNGFSLIRKLIDLHGLKLDQFVEDLGTTLGEELLRPTRIYVRSILSLLEEFPIKGMAHITGGGLIGNLPRVMPKGLGVVIRPKWEVPPIFKLIQSLGVKEDEMWRVFNMGVGFTVVLSPQHVESFLKRAHELGEKAFIIGEVVEGEGVRVKG